jgi:hypothetical protein
VAVVVAIGALGVLATYEYQKKQEYEIYSVVLNKLLSEHQAKAVVLWDQTSVGTISRYPIWNDLQATLRYNDEHPSRYDDIPMIRGMEKTTDEAWANFKKRNTQTVKIDVSHFSLPVLVTAYALDPSMQPTKEPWGDFYRRYPGSWGWTELSRVGFDRGSSGGGLRWRLLRRLMRRRIPLSCHKIARRMEGHG